MKIVLLLGLALVTLSYVGTVFMGMTARRNRGMWVNVHMWFAQTTLLLLILYVVAVEVCVHIKGGAHHDAFFYVHLVFAVSTTTALILMIGFGFDGQKWPLHHAKLAYASCCTFFGMVLTGLWMITNRF